MADRDNEAMEQNTEPKKILEMHESPKDTERGKRIKKEIFDWIKALLFALVVVFVLRSFFFTVIRVQGSSMLETLQDGDRLFVSVLDMKLSGPERGDILIVHYPGRSEEFVKRLIGMPGDTLEVTGGVLLINGEPVDEDYLDPDCTARFHSGRSDFGPIEIPEGEYFVMGDNRDNSNDSRSVGTITKDMIIGKVRAVFWPITEARWVE